tara:strand:+ start:1328 stop:1879 length:552 start_codon:yes stop_codon:yes gene_type:complete
MFANDDNEKNIQTYAALLQDIREGKEGIDEATSIHLQEAKNAKNSVHARAMIHHGIISDINGRYDGHEDENREGSHLHKTSSELEQLAHNHKKLSDIHHAHATLHYIAGNHEAASDHEEIANQHRNAAHVSNHHHMRNTPVANRETHEGFSHFSDHINADSEDALEEHPITTKMLTKIPAVKR